MKTFLPKLILCSIAIGTSPAAFAQVAAPHAAPSGGSAISRPDLAIGLGLGSSTFDATEQDASTVSLSGIADFGRLAVIFEIQKSEHDHQSRVDKDLAVSAQFSLFGSAAWDGYVFGGIGVGFAGVPTGYPDDTEYVTQGLLKGGIGVAATLSERLSLTFDLGRERRHLSVGDDPILQYVWIETDEWLTRARLGLVLAL